MASDRRVVILHCTTKARNIEDRKYDALRDVNCDAKNVSTWNNQFQCDPSRVTLCNRVLISVIYKGTAVLGEETCPPGSDKLSILRGNLPVPFIVLCNFIATCSTPFITQG